MTIVLPGILDNRRAAERHARLELVAVVDRRLVDALERVVDVALALHGGFDLAPVASRFGMVSLPTSAEATRWTPTISTGASSR